MIADIRFALRAFARNPGFAALSILTLALGIGANSAMFTLVRQVLLKSLPVENPQELVEFGCLNPMRTERFNCTSSYPGFEMYRGNTVLSGMFAFAGTGDLNLVHKGSAEMITGMYASGEMYGVLGLRPALGRLINAADDAAGAAPVLVLSHEFWQRRFGGDPRIAGETLRLNGVAFTVAGVTPPWFRGVALGMAPDVTLPLAATDLFRAGRLREPGNWWLRIIGRKKSGVSMERAQAALDPTFRRTLDHMVAALPADMAVRMRDFTYAHRFRLEPAVLGAGSDFRRNLDQPLRILMAAVGLVLLIACGNLAGLLLSRAIRRRREFAVRLAMGAGRGRLLRHVLAESLLLALAGGLLGLVVSQWGGEVLLALAAGETGLRAVDLKPDLAVLAFTAAVSVLTGVLFGIGPALRAAHSDPQAGLREARGAAATSPLARALIVGQVALTVVLLAGAGLFLRTLANFRNLDLGFRKENLVTLSVNPGLVGYEPARVRGYMRQVMERVEALPGVRAATFAFSGMGGLRNVTVVEVPGFRETSMMEKTTGRNWVGPRFVETHGLTLLRGRDIARSDHESAPKVALVNESFARHFCGGVDAAGRRFGFMGQKDFPITVVGVVRDARDRGPKTPSERVVYTVFAQDAIRSATLTVRAAAPPDSLLQSLTAALKEIDPLVPVYSVQVLEDQIDAALNREKLVATLGALFGGVALLLAAVGIYGVLAAAVVQRTNEIGIRMALGARRANVLWLVLRDASFMVGAGALIGLAGAAALTRLVRSQLFGVAPSDPLTLASAVLVLLLVAAAAVFLPARRASRVDPISALRYE